MKCRFSSSVEVKLLQNMAKIASNSEGILINHLQKMVCDILRESFSHYRAKNRQIIATKNIGFVLGCGVKTLLGSYTKGELSNNISKTSQLQSDLDTIEQQLNTISELILKMKYEKLFMILKINKKQGLLDAINHSLVVQIEVSKRV